MQRKIYGMPDITSSSHAHRHGRNISLPLKLLFFERFASDSETTVFHVGNYVPVKDERFGIEKNIRIQKVTKNLLVEHDYTLTLSDITAISPITQTVVDVGRTKQS